MSGGAAHTAFTLIKQNMLWTYVGVGLGLNIIRKRMVDKAYEENFARYDLERKSEFKEKMSKSTQGQ